MMRYHVLGSSGVKVSEVLEIEAIAYIEEDKACQSP